MNCFNPSCNEEAQESSDEYRGFKIRVCKAGHRTVKVPDEKSTSQFHEAA